METSVRVVLCIYQIYMFLYGLVLMVLSILCYQSIGDPLTNYELVLSNWAQNPITEIYSGSVCNSQDVVLNDYRWPGTVDGCDCRDASFSYSGLYRGGCDENQTDAGCSGINSVGSRKFWNFTDQQQTFTFTLCGTLDKSFDFLNQAPQTYDCPSGTIKCGEQDMFICTNQTKCPIVDFGYFNDNNQQNEHLIITDTFKLWYNRFTAGLFPLVDFKMAEGEGVCFQNTEQSITPGRSDYLLMEVFKEDCGKDLRFRQLYTMNEKWFYEINRSLDLPKLLPEYSIDARYKWGLYYRGYIPWRMECRGEIKKQFQQQQSILRELYEIQYALFISTIVYFSVIAAVVNLISVFISAVAIIFIIFNFMFQVSFSTLTAMQLIQAGGEVDIFNKIYNLNCTDNETQWVIQDLSHNLNEYAYSYNVGLFSISMVGFIFYVIPILYYFCWCFFECAYLFKNSFHQSQQIQNQQIKIQQIEIREVRYNGDNPDEKNMESNPINYPKM